MKTARLAAVDCPAEAITRAIADAARLLRAGEVVAFPTETVYGLGADAFNPAAVEKVFAAKGRPADNPLIVHVATRDDIDRCAIVTPRAERLIARLTPGPVTVVLPARPAIPTSVRAGLPTVAVRMPNHPIALELLRQAGPLVAPSANTSGRPSPTTARHVLDDLDGRIAAVLDGGACDLGLESTVVDLSEMQARILREGLITRAAIAEALGEPVASGDTNVVGRPRAPGMKYRHYAPHVPVRLVTGPAAAAWRAPEDGLRRLRLVARDQPTAAAAPDPDERLLDARTLYATLRDAEAAGYDEIVVLIASPESIPDGLLDRVRRAASPA